jgi:ribonuclease T
LSSPYHVSRAVTYISVDIECSGPIPAEYSMLSIGACVIGRESQKDYCFYIEIQPISRKYVKEALEVTGFSMESLKVNGSPAKDAMIKFADWIGKVSGRKKAIFVASPITFDWSFVNYYFHKFLGYNPFGIAGIDLKSVWIGRTNNRWHKTRIDDIKKILGLNYVPHTHNALEDAQEQSLIFKKIMEYRPVCI